MQKIIRVYYDAPMWNELEKLERVNELLEDGWEVVSMQPFTSNIYTENGSHGMTFLLDDSNKSKNKENDNTSLNKN